MALSMDQMALELNLISVQRDEAPAKVELLEKALREVTEGKIKIEKILQYYDNPIRNRTITGREINKQKKEWKQNHPTWRKGRSQRPR